ncbi:uncharacterized protein LOC141712264 isoform X2 [Apium graveolens]|uniref:uncharacterized protein LOC141712264 isoform X2 n=1 Tax=Apium graveolens TaxID=4045 RepID=UPI003D7B1712
MWLFENRRIGLEIYIVIILSKWAEEKINYQVLWKDFKSGGRKTRQLPISFQPRHCITSFETSYFLSLFGGGHEKETAHALQEPASVIDFFPSLFSLQIQTSGVKLHGGVKLYEQVIKPMNPFMCPRCYCGPIHPLSTG